MPAVAALLSQGELPSRSGRVSFWKNRVPDGDVASVAGVRGIPALGAPKPVRSAMTNMLPARMIIVPNLPVTTGRNE